MIKKIFQLTVIAAVFASFSAFAISARSPAQTCDHIKQEKHIIKSQIDEGNPHKVTSTVKVRNDLDKMAKDKGC